MITFRIDEILPCLKKVDTDEIYETEVIQIRRKSFLSKFNKKTGWYVNWSKFPEETEVYALVLKGTVSIQGMIAVEKDEDAKAIYIRWACVSPHNNIWQFNKQEFSGVGGHLLAIAAELSIKNNFGGFVYGEAVDQELFEYYCEKYNALPLPVLSNPYRFMLSDKATEIIREVYNYDWTDEII